MICENNVTTSRGLADVYHGYNIMYPGYFTSSTGAQPAIPPSCSHIWKSDARASGPDR